MIFFRSTFEEVLYCIGTSADQLFDSSYFTAMAAEQDGGGSKRKSVEYSDMSVFDDSEQPPKKKLAVSPGESRAVGHRHFLPMLIGMCSQFGGRVSLYDCLYECSYEFMYPVSLSYPNTSTWGIKLFHIKAIRPVSLPSWPITTTMSKRKGRRRELTAGFST